MGLVLGFLNEKARKPKLAESRAVAKEPNSRGWQIPLSPRSRLCRQKSMPVSPACYPFRGKARRPQGPISKWVYRAQQGYSPQRNISKH